MQPCTRKEDETMETTKVIVSILMDKDVFLTLEQRKCLESIQSALADRDATIAEMREALEGIQALAPDKATHIHAICENILSKYPQVKK